MVDGGIIGLIVLAVFISLVIVSVLIVAGVEASRSTGPSTPTSPTVPCNQTVDISSLPQLPDSAVCIQGGVRTSLFYLGTGGFDYVVAPWGVSPRDVCVGFCTNIKDNVCTGPDYKGESAQTNFDNCMKQLSTTTCIPPLPIAARGTTLYYAHTPTCNECDNCASFLS